MKTSLKKFIESSKKDPKEISVEKFTAPPMKVSVETSSNETLCRLY